MIRHVARSVALLWVVLATVGCMRVEEPDLVIWHAYRGAEAVALHQVVDLYRDTNPTVRVEVVYIPHAAYANKISSGVPRGNGPDVFIFAQERIGAWADASIIAPLEDERVDALLGRLPQSVTDAVRYRGDVWGVPLATKTLALFYNPGALARLGVDPPQTTDAMIDAAIRFTDVSAGRFGLVYPVGDFFFHSAWFFGFGAELEDGAGRPTLNTSASAASLAFAARMRNEHRIIPRDAEYNVVKDRFVSGNALFAVNGPWFLGEIGDTPFGIVPLPTISETGTPARPFVTVESAYLTTQIDPRRVEDAVALMVHLSSVEASIIRAEHGRQAVVHPDAYDHPSLRDDHVLQAFRAAADQGTPMPNTPQMQAIWDPGRRALEQTLRGNQSLDHIVRAADAEIARTLAPPPPPTRAEPYLVGLSLLMLVAAFAAVRRARTVGLGRQIRRSWRAYLYIAPAFFATLLLIFLPFFVGGLISLYAHHEGEFTFVGFANFVRILSAEGFGITHPQSFYLTLVVTVLWTVANVVLHVTIGLMLAMALRDPWVKLRGVYRVLLILPWAIPNYITALIWKSMFNFNFGSINAVLVALGIEPVDWFSSFATAFAANLSTNTWLGFPFMMVVSLGALQSIPRDLDDAAEVDGASRWQRFRHITLPLLKPALLPAVVIGSVWTFNMFNIIYLVSGGGPDASTDILITEAYRWAFERQSRYGYAAAYGVLIFGVLVLYTWLTTRGASQEVIDGT